MEVMSADIIPAPACAEQGQQEGRGGSRTQGAISAIDTIAPVHIPIMVGEVLECLRLAPGHVVVDCTFGGGGHAEAMLHLVRPGGRLLGLDVDPLELPLADARLRAAGFGQAELVTRRASFAELPAIMTAAGFPPANAVLADLGTSSMQNDTPARGFSYKGVGPLDMRMNPLEGMSAAELIAQVSAEELTALLEANADEPHAALIAGVLCQHRVQTTHAAERLIRAGLKTALPALPRAEVKMSIRRTFQALRIAVNDEFRALDALLAGLPGCLAPGGRVAILTFHSGEDRRVKKAFAAGRRAGVYAAVSDAVIRSAKAETFANRRASAAKLRWAERG